VEARLIHADGRTDVKKLDFKLPPCSECYIFFFWVIPRRMNFICRRFGTHCLCRLRRSCKQEQDLRRWRRQSVSKGRRIKFRRRGIFLLTPPMKMEQTECFETSAYKIQTPGNHPTERIQNKETYALFASRRTRLKPTYNTF